MTGRQPRGEERVTKGFTERLCKGCGEWKRPAEYRTVKGYLVWRCKSCDNEYSRKYQEKNLFARHMRTIYAPKETDEAKPFSGSCVDIKRLDQFLRARRIA